MRHHSFEAIDTSRPVSAQLAVLDAAIGAPGSAAGRSVRTSGGNPSPEEGLALLDAYVTISDQHVRQAVLDVVSAIAAVGGKA